MTLLARAPDARYRGVAFRAYSAGHGQEVVSLLLEERAMLAPQHTGSLLSACREFLSLDEHAETICRRAGLAPARAAAMRRRLASLVDAGLLTRHDALLARCRTAVSAPPQAPIEAIGMPSCDRVEVLARGLRSYARNVRDHGRDVEITVVDDSRWPVSRRANRATLAAVAREYGIRRMAYADADDRARFAVALAREAGIRPETVSLALLPNGMNDTTVGACRNTLLLQSVGERAVQADDDTVCHLAPLPASRGGIALASAGDPTESYPFGDAAEARAAVSFVEQDFLALYERVLGWGVAGLMNGLAAADVALDRLEARFAQQIAAGPCHVAIATVGMVGDSGMGSSEGYLLASEADLERVWRSGEDYRRALESRQVVRAAPMTTLAEYGPCLGLSLGVDHRTVLPPFSPAMRNEDGVFAAARSMTLPATAMAYLPWVVEHVPATERRASVEQMLRGAGILRPPDVLIGWILAFGGGDGPIVGGPRFEELGRYLVELGSLAAPLYAERRRGMQAERIAATLAHVERMLGATVNAPRRWRSDLQAYREALTRAATSAAVIAHDDDGCGQRFVREYGELLRAWPSLVAASRTLRERGTRPALPVATRGGCLGS